MSNFNQVLMKTTTFAALLATLGSTAVQAVDTHPQGVTVTGPAIVNSTAQNPSDGTLYVEGDSILDDNVCIGNTCSSGMTFANDESLVFKFVQLSIKFIDTSSSTSPGNDWTLRVNDPNSVATGGINKFSVEDDTADTTPFTIEAGLPDHALYVESDGDIGFGTNNPAMDLHIVSTDTPTVRLDQRTGGGNPAQIWDISGNEGYFSISDITGATQPFRASPGAPTSSIDISANGYIGIGTDSPAGPLEVTNKDTYSFIRLTASDATPNQSVDVVFADAGSAGELRYNIIDGDGPEMLLDAAGNITVTGSVFSAGSPCGGGCDRVFDADYALPSIEEHAALMWDSRHLPAVGPTPENAPINISDKLGRVLNELEHAHIYIEQLNAQQKQQMQQTAYLIAEIAALKLFPRLVHQCGWQLGRRLVWQGSEEPCETTEPRGVASSFRTV